MTKLTADDKDMIIILWDTGKWTQQQLADKFNVHKTRVNHLIKNTYNERDDSDGLQD